MKKQGFIKGAAILMIANGISKILGAVFKIPMTYIVHEEGMAVFNTAFQIYIMILGFVICGFPLAISKSAAESAERGDRAAAEKMLRAAERLLCGMGLLGSLIMYAGAFFFAAAAKEPNAAFAVRMLAPSVFLVAWGTAYKSYFQGLGNMIPTAVSQVTEAFIKLAAGFLLCAYLIRRSVAEAAGGVALGVSMGELFATLILWGMYLREGHRTRLNRTEFYRETRLLMSIALPILLISLISNMLSLIDISVIRLRLEQCVFDGEESARFLRYYGRYTELFNRDGSAVITNAGAGWLYGAYSGFALTVFNLPLGILATLGVTIMPVIAGSMAAGDMGRAGRAALKALRLSAFFSVPAAVLLFFFSSDILRLLFHNDASARLLSILAPGLVITAMSSLGVTVLHSSGRIFPPFLIGFLGMLLKLGVQWVLAADGGFHIEGIPIGFLCGELFCLIGIFWYLNQKIGLRLRYRDILIRPVVGGAAMVGILLVLWEPVRNGLPETAALGVMVCVSGLVYLLTELLILPKSEKNIAIGRKM